MVGSDSVVWPEAESLPADQPPPMPPRRVAASWCAASSACGHRGRSQATCSRRPSIARSAWGATTGPPIW